MAKRKDWDYEVEHTVRMADALDRIDYKYPDAKVIGHVRGRPLIKFPNGDVASMTVTGTLRPVRNDG